MAFKYLFELNGVELQDVSIGATAIEKFEEPLDEGSLRLPFTIRNYEYEMLGYLKITIEDGNSTQKILNFLIISDEVNEGSKYGEFIHEITIVEYTHKYDKYLVHSLAKTKSIKDNNPAKFLYNQQMYLNSGTSTGYNMKVWIPPLDIKSTYYSNEQFSLERVSKGIQATMFVTGNRYNYNDNIEVYIKINGIRYTLSSNDVSVSLNAGNYEIEYGFVAVGNDYSLPIGDTWLYKYQVRIIDIEIVSVLDALNLIRNTVSRFGGIESKLYFEKTRMFNIDPSIESKLASIELPQTYIQKATLRQVLNSIFLYVNAISRLYNDETNEIDLLSMDEFNKITGSFTMSDVAGYQSSQESSQLGSKGVSWLERLLPNNRENPNIIEPSGNQFKTVRSNNVQITEDSFGLELNKTLYEPKKFEFLLDRLYIYDGASSDLLETKINYEIVLTPRFIPFSEWKIKEITTNFPNADIQGIFNTNVGLRENMVGNLYWQQNSNYIELSKVFGIALASTLVKNTLKEALNEQLTRNPTYPLINFAGDMVTSYTLKFDGYENGIYKTNLTLFDDLDWQYYKFNLEYITQENSTVEVDRQDLTYLNYYSELRQNQSDKLINVELASRKSYGDLQRSGVPNRTFKKYHTDLSSIYNIGSEDDEGFVITKRKFEFHNNYIAVTYNATKDHNRLSQYIGLQQEYRWSEIPQTNQIFERIEPYRDYIFLTKPNVLLIEETTKIANDYTMKLLFGNLINDWQNSITGGKTKVTSAYLRTLEFLEEYPDDTYKYAISNPVNSFAKKGGLVFQFGFENNQIALSAVKEEGKNRYNKAIRYTDDLGNMDEMWFQLSREYDITTSDSGWTEKETNDNYPLIRTNKPTGETYANFGSLEQMAFISGPSTPIFPTYDALIVHKDKSQNIKIPYQLNVVPYDYKTFVIGQEFFNENFLVKNPNQKEYQVLGTKMLVYVYDDFTPYGIFDDLKIKSGYNKALVLFSGVNVEIDTTEKTFRFLSTTLTDVLNGANWAIGDEFGNLYLACNENLEGFNFFKRHFIQNLLEIGNRERPSPPIIHFDELIIEATVTGEIQHVLATSMILDGTIKIDLLDPVEAQDEYEYNELKTEYKGFFLQNSINLLLSSNIQATLSKELGEDNYESSDIVIKYWGGISQESSTVMILESMVTAKIEFELAEDYYGSKNINTQISGNLIQSKLEMILEGSIEGNITNQSLFDYQSMTNIFINYSSEIFQTTTNMDLNGIVSSQLSSETGEDIVEGNEFHLKHSTYLMQNYNQMILDGDLSIRVSPEIGFEGHGSSEVSAVYKGDLSQTSLDMILEGNLLGNVVNENYLDYQSLPNIYTKYQGDIKRSVSTSMQLEGLLLTGVEADILVGYESLPNIYTKYQGDIKRSVSTSMQLEGLLLTGVEADILVGYESSPSVRTQYSGEIQRVLATSMVLEGNISTTLFNEIKPEYMTNNVLFGNIKGGLIQTRANMVLQNGLKVAVIPEVYAPIYTWTPIPDTIPNSSPSTICDITNIGKIKCDSYCQFVGRNLMFSLSDLTNNPECGDGVEKWTCVKDGKFWKCTLYEGTIKYENCLECKEVIE